MQLNPKFISNIQDLYGEAGLTWLNHLPSQIDKICLKHNLRFLQPLPNLTYHFLGLAESLSTAETAIFKMAPTDHSNIALEAKWLRCFDKAVPKVYWVDEEHHAFMMEQLIPGQSLKAMAKIDDDKATRIICQTILDLQTHQKMASGFKHLSELAKSFAVLKGRMDDKLLSQAQTWFADLTSDRSQDILLHGDLHHDNILSSGDGWKVIDPHGYIGDPAFAVGTMIYNPQGDAFPTERPIGEIIQRRLAILIEELPFDPQRIKAWAFCMTMLSIAWTVEDHQYVPDFELSVAKLLAK